MKKVAIIGHGYVGKAMRALFERGPFDVRVYDPNQDEHRYRERVLGCDLAVICVPTAQAANGACDTSIVVDEVRRSDAGLVLIKSTVTPGTTDILAASTGKAVHFSPEYLGEPKNFVPPWRYPDPRDAVKHDWVIVGGPRASEVLDYFATVMAVSSRFIACDACEAELAKYMENAYFATKVAFCNEFAGIAAAHGVDYKRLRELWLLDPRMEPDHTMVFTDKRGFSGKCLPKDLAAIVNAAGLVGFDPLLLRAVIESNQRARE